MPKITLRILLISDIHASLEGLAACLEAAPAYDHVFNLGDIVGYGASPNEVTEQSRSLGFIFVRGNHDKACTGVSSVEDFNPVAAMAAMWTKNILTRKNLEWLRLLPPGPIRITDLPSGNGELSLPLQPAIECVHGSPEDEDDYMIEIEDALDSLSRPNTQLTFFGHTHIQGAFSTNGNEWVSMRPRYRSENKFSTFEMPLRKNFRYLINPGSAGQPRDHDWRAAFCLYDSEEHVVTFFRVPYDLKAAQKKILAANLPQRLALRLEKGR